MSEKIGRYEIQSEIGRGSMGVVYRAHDPLLRRVIALKTILIPAGIPPEDVQEFEERFFQEARAAARLSHHAIVLVHDIGRDPQTRTLFMALEFLSGQTIAEMTAGGKALEWREAVRIAELVAEALYHASLLGVVHRDIKPANIMVLPSGEPKIMDFGIAKVETARLKLTGVGDSLGTPLYMSPEQAMGEEADHRSDLFSLGATLYRMLTGLDAFAASNIPGIIKRVVEEDPEPPSRKRSGVPAALDVVLSRALAKQRADRYADAKALADDLRDVLKDHAPRHAAGGVRTEVGSGTLAEDALESSDAGTFDPMEAMAALVPDAPQPAPSASAKREAQPPAVVSAPATPRVSPVLQRAGPPADTHGSRVPWKWIAAAAAVVIVGAAAVAALRSPSADTASVAEPTPQTPMDSPAAPATTQSSRRQERASPPPAEAEVPARTTTTPPPATEAGGPATLLIDFEHGLKSGRLRVWVDDDLVLEDRLDSRVTKKVLVLKSRKGSLEEALEVTPGRHEIRVEVAWDDSVKTRVISGNFRSGSKRRLAAKVGGLLRKNLSVEWE